MILLISAVLGLMVGLITGGSLRRARLYPLKGLALPIVAFLIKAGAAYFLPPQTGAILVCVLQYALIFAFLLLNFKRPVWPVFALLGSLCNFFVILLNGGCMPVSALLVGAQMERLEQLEQNGIYAYCLANEHTKLEFLGDILRIGPAGMPFGFASVGDVTLCIGIAILFYQLVKYKSNDQTAIAQS